MPHSVGKVRNEKRTGKQTNWRLWKANSLQCLSSEYDIGIRRLHEQESVSFQLVKLLIDETCSIMHLQEVLRFLMHNYTYLLTLFFSLLWLFVLTVLHNCTVTFQWISNVILVDLPTSPLSIIAICTLSVFSAPKEIEINDQEESTRFRIQRDLY